MSNIRLLAKPEKRVDEGLLKLAEDFLAGVQSGEIVGAIIIKEQPETAAIAVNTANPHWMYLYATRAIQHVIDEELFEDAT